MAETDRLPTAAENTVSAFSCGLIPLGRRDVKEIH